jgi:hypothetical protein
MNCLDPGIEAKKSPSDEGPARESLDIARAYFHEAALSEGCGIDAVR